MNRCDASKKSVVLTVGHSTRGIDAFIALLKAHDVVLVADVRTIPRSRHNPQFNAADMAKALRHAGIGYVHLPDLGGLRHARRDSPNMAWRNKSFRGYADYMGTPEFEAAIEDLIGRAGKQRAALMCAEAVPWRCHRSLIADALAARGIAVEHIMGMKRREPHRTTPWARIQGHHVTYPAEDNSGREASPSRKNSTRRSGPRQKVG